ncbi:MULTISPECIES: Crp/Fnr family transcriptional regulator [unclassified Bradyrhizobium]|uniref:Crp/Fnr family transcriptional regulator n=1 Tax=unclassified Bradyrhizobium TaxID=2631580 RepID=UPI001FFC1262|nr:MULTISPECIES: Crp/Fnr family transcriptional regulator [unclassified Bradyrhizobium]MCK1304372.1 Crp/Fnr family transcriptional regulator [Bradyrhizobium sp. 45]MCK1435434.1 Crp/Fnr family transcriptional regulator [Bradyrhizobium sp. 15]MCK1451956.1 Crp/Fnr family transcriptional regulator [Bradyrhizobium sp. 35]MCK1614864.1 Crp/Fnr family transcriptional regulator [Bradyrhizobium sp. 163]MCK1760174.1 Crp/Fnr family transcriptional regulator [Bradyrhizobium sp. 136]
MQDGQATGLVPTSTAPEGRVRPLAARNKLLRCIPEMELTVLRSIGMDVELKPRQVLHHWRLPMEYVYFLGSGLVSVSAKVDDGRFVEAWLVGSEGMIGAPCVLAPEDPMPPHRRVVQVGGTALRIPTPAFLAALDDLGALRGVILSYINLVLFQTSQVGACNSLHSVKQRLARWLLVAANAMDSGELSITHAVLAQLLGIRRASVSECLETFEQAGIIRNTRAAIALVDRARLEHFACSCSGLIQREYDRQIGRRLRS